MRRGGNIVKIIGALVALWLIALVAIGLIGGRTIEKRVIARVGEPLQATATIDRTELALIRGHLDLTKIHVIRDEGGHLEIDVGDIRCDLPPFGLALIDDDCRTLTIRGMRVNVSAAGVFKLRKASSPVHARKVVIDDAILDASPSALAPGLGKIQITVEHAEANDTLFKTPFSWIFALESLRAKVVLPGDIEVKLGYEHGKLTVAGAMFGSKPIELPFAIPVADLADDPAGELKKLAKLGKDIGEEVLAQRAKDWFLNKLKP